VVGTAKAVVVVAMGLVAAGMVTEAEVVVLSEHTRCSPCSLSTDIWLPSSKSHLGTNRHISTVPAAVVVMAKAAAATAVMAAATFGRLAVVMAMEAAVMAMAAMATEAAVMAMAAMATAAVAMAMEVAMATATGEAASIRQTQEVVTEREVEEKAMVAMAMEEVVMVKEAVEKAMTMVEVMGSPMGHRLA
jgi:hypothetical protein